MQNGTRKLERYLRSCFSAMGLFAALGEHEDIISPAPITILFIIWWKRFPCCFPSPSFPSSWLSHMQKQCFLLSVEYFTSLSQYLSPTIPISAIHCSKVALHWEEQA